MSNEEKKKKNTPLAIGVLLVCAAGIFWSLDDALELGIISEPEVYDFKRTPVTPSIGNTVSEANTPNKVANTQQPAVRVPPKYDTAIQHETQMAVFNLIQRARRENKANAVAFGAQKITFHEERERLRIMRVQREIAEENLKKKSAEKELTAEIPSSLGEMPSLDEATYYDQVEMTHHISVDELRAEEILVKGVVNKKAYISIGKRDFDKVKEGQVLASRYLVQKIEPQRECVYLIDISKNPTEHHPNTCMN